MKRRSTMRKGHISASGKTRQQVGLQRFALGLKARFNPFQESVDCIIDMR